MRPSLTEMNAESFTPTPVGDEDNAYAALTKFTPNCPAGTKAVGEMICEDGFWNGTDGDPGCKKNCPESGMV